MRNRKILYSFAALLCSGAFLVGGTAPIVAPALASAAISTAAPYSPLTPSRLVDTRTTGKIAANGTLSLQVLGKNGVPATGVDSVVLNVTVVNPAGAGFLTVFPSGNPTPNVSNVNYVKDQVVANQVVAKVGADGKINIFSGNTATDVVVDVSGYFVTGAAYKGLDTPVRFLDTRNSGTTPTGSMVPKDSSVSFQVLGVNGVPATDVDSVIVNVTDTNSTAPGFLTVYPSGTAVPIASNVNYASGQTAAGLAIAKVGADGKVSIKAGSQSHVIADVVGYIPKGSGYWGMNPKRILDTRPSEGYGGITKRVLGGQEVVLPVAGVAGVPTDASAVSLNITVAQPDNPGFITEYPNGVALPDPASNVNYTAGDVRANSVIAKVGTDGKVRIYTTATTDIIVDISGYFGPSAPTSTAIGTATLTDAPKIMVGADFGWSAATQGVINGIKNEGGFSYAQLNGDFTYGRTSVATFSNALLNALPGVPISIGPGNHEGTNPKFYGSSYSNYNDYLPYFPNKVNAVPLDTPAARGYPWNYYYDVNGARVIVTSPNIYYSGTTGVLTYNAGTQELTAFKNAVASAKAAGMWVISVHHESWFDPGGHSGDTANGNNTGSKDLALAEVAGKVDLVMAGHSTNYSRSNQVTGISKPTSGAVADNDGNFRSLAGTVFMLPGTGGDPIKQSVTGPNATWPVIYSTTSVGAQYGYATIEVAPKTLSVKFKVTSGSKAGTVGDSFTINR